MSIQHIQANLLPKKLIVKAKYNQLKRVFFRLCVLLIGLIAVEAGLAMAVNFINLQNVKANKELTARIEKNFEVLSLKVSQVEASIETYNMLAAQRTAVVPVVDKLAFYRNEAVFFSEISFKSGTLQVSGWALSTEKLADFLLSYKQDPQLKDLQLTTLEQKDGVLLFRLQKGGLEIKAGKGQQEVKGIPPKAEAEIKAAKGQEETKGR